MSLRIAIGGLSGSSPGLHSPGGAAVGGIGSSPDAMIYYVAHGAADACGPGCSDWIAGEGTVQWVETELLDIVVDRQAEARRAVEIPRADRARLHIVTT